MSRRSSKFKLFESLRRMDYLTIWFKVFLLIKIHFYIFLLTFLFTFLYIFFSQNPLITYFINMFLSYL
jgi:hypothetical protein